MASTFTYSSVSSATTLLDSTGATGDGGGADLKSLTNNSIVGAPVVTPTSGAPEVWGGYMATLAYASAPTSGKLVMQCWFVDAQDNSTYDSTNATNQPTRAPDFVFYWPTVSSAGPFNMQSVPRLVQRPPWKHKIVCKNIAGQTTTSTNNQNKLFGVTVNHYSS